MKLSKLLNATNTTTVMINDDPVTIKYRVNLITEENTAQALENDDDRNLRETLSKTVIEWDMTDDSEPPQNIPCTVDVLNGIDIRIVSGIWMALLEASSPNVRTGNISPAG